MQKNLFVKTVFILALLVLWADGAAASSPWQWKMTLQGTDKPGKPMNHPTAIHIDEDSQRYYVVDSGSGRLLAYSRDGDFLSSFTASNNLKTPFDVIRKPGMLWVVEKGRNSVTTINLKDKKIKPLNIKDDGRSIYPDRIEALADNFYLLDKASGNVFSLNKELEVTNRFTCKNCSGGFVDFKLKNGKLWALEQSSKEVMVFSQDGKFEFKVQLKGSEIAFPRSIAVDNNNYLYILDRHRGMIFVYDSSGHFKYSFLTAGEARSQLYYPIEIKFDPWGQLCVVEEGNGRVQIFSQR